jgi:SAM-dependent methyltransferase
VKKSTERRLLEGGWYDYPAYYDVAFQEETELEADFVQDAWKKHGSGDSNRLLEPGCGSGRLVLELAKRGLQLAGFDDNAKALEFLETRLRDANVKASVFRGDMAAFEIAEPIDLAFSFCNTFRHLLTIEAAESHLRCMAKALNPGGLYLLGLHLMPIDADPNDSEQWDADRDGVKVSTTLKVQKTFEKERTEILRVTLDVDAPEERLRIRCFEKLRLWTLQEFRELLGRVPEFDHIATYDFVYDVDDPIDLDEYTSDAVFVLRKLAT